MKTYEITLPLRVVEIRKKEKRKKHLTESGEDIIFMLGTIGVFLSFFAIYCILWTFLIA